VKLAELIAHQPPVRHIPGAREQIRNSLIASGKRLVVIDDDPTGAQAIHGVRIFLDWTVDTLRKAIASGEPVFFISTNSRSLSPNEVRNVSLEVGRNLREAAELEGANILLTSRGDSTLRGHFPYEVEALTSGLSLKPDGIIIVPAFFEGGRYTVDDIHYAEQDGELVAVHLTEFARDPVFGYKNSDLKAWVSEKADGKTGTGDVRSISLKMLRGGGPEAVTGELLKAANGTPVIVNATCYEDLEVLVFGITAAEEKGKKFVYRCAASFIKARGGFEDRPLLTHHDLASGGRPGLIVIGSYVEKTSRQLKLLLESGLVEGAELHVWKLHKDESRKSEIESVSERVNQKLAAGATTVLYTSRAVEESRDFRETGSTIMQSLCEVVSRIRHKPGYIIAKGGTTSLELAHTALRMREAYASGQILGGVPVWRPGTEARWPDNPYVVFPGNVGGEDALLRVVKTLEEV